MVKDEKVEANDAHAAGGLGIDLRKKCTMQHRQPLSTTNNNNTTLRSVMSAHREPNPLRPYYNPPSISEPFAGASGSTGQNVSSKPVSAPSQSFGTSARNILADMDYSDYVSDSSSGASDAVKAFLEQMAWKYSSVFLAQPFEVSRTLLQVQVLSIRDKKASKDPYVEEWTRKQASYRQDSDVWS